MSKLTKQQIFFRRRLLVCAVFVVFILLIFIICSIISGGSDSEPESGKNEPKGALSFQTAKLELGVGDGYMLIPSFAAEAQKDIELTYSSENNEIATVDIYGGVKAISEGTTNIIAESSDKSIRSIVPVTVKKSGATTSGQETTSGAQDTTAESQQTTAKSEETTAGTTAADDGTIVKEITLSTYAVKVAVGEKKMPMVTMKPDTAKDKGEIWSSSDEKIAKVDKYGNITGVKAGKCKVTVKASANQSVSAEVDVTVTEVSTANGATYINDILVVNKSYSLPSSFNPGGIEDEVKKAFEQMQKAAVNDNIKLWIQSGFRSYSYQQSIYNNNVNKYGVEKTDTFSARPGHSEHQTGLAFDINVINDTFAGTPEAVWVEKNSYKYGFIVRYPKGKENITGYKYEPWHLRYLGVETATSVFNSGLCLEEYLGIDSKYAN